VKVHRVAERQFARRIQPHPLRDTVEQRALDVHVNGRQRLSADRLPPP